jgi:hypothetical protein
VALKRGGEILAPFGRRDIASPPPRSCARQRLSREVQSSGDWISRGEAEIAKFKMDDNPEVVTRFGARSAPTPIIFKGGETAAVSSRAASSAKSWR